MLFINLPTLQIYVQDTTGLTPCSILQIQGQKTARPVISRSSGLWWSDKERKNKLPEPRVIGFVTEKEKAPNFLGAWKDSD